MLRDEGRSRALQEAEMREIMAAATEAGIAERTLRRARERICQRPRRLDGHWIGALAERKTNGFAGGS